MNVIYLGCNGFPVGFAQVQKQKMICLTLISVRAEVTVVCHKGVLAPSSAARIERHGVADGIKYLYTSRSAYRPSSFTARNFQKVSGRINEVMTVFRLRKKGARNIAIVSTKNLFALVCYRITLSLAGFRMALSHEEFVSSPSRNGGKKPRISFDHHAHKFCDAILPISHFLESLHKKLDPRVKTFRVPVLTDFDTIDAVARPVPENVLLFCGAAAYAETIRFVIESFDRLKSPSVALRLILHGNRNDMAAIAEFIRIHCGKKDQVSILGGLPYNSLIAEYKKAAVLLIPLLDNDRDIARFPHKIGEYTASKTPMVTTRIGEIQKYFTDGVNAFVAPDATVEAYAQKIDDALADNVKRQQIAANAYITGRSNFHFAGIGPGLSSFLQQI